jgi:2-polyprenyl-3-methyl-5-hydroxy-6-metoxy-1,4-benzoquinol methylase
VVADRSGTCQYPAMLQQLIDIPAFKSRRAAEWVKAEAYWLSAPLRHVVDIGDIVLDRITQLLTQNGGGSVIDAACGSGWVLEGLTKRGSTASYTGVDINTDFLAHVQALPHDSPVTLIDADLEQRWDSAPARASVVVSALTQIELADIDNVMANLASMTDDNGTLLIATIDKTYLMLAAADGDPAALKGILCEYEHIPGVKYFFQPIDLGDGASDKFAYASVLYTTEDFINAAAAAGMTLSSYREIPATDRPIPKIYQLFEFRHRR